MICSDAVPVKGEEKESQGSLLCMIRVKCHKEDVDMEDDGFKERVIEDTGENSNHSESQEAELFDKGKGHLSNDLEEKQNETIMIQEKGKNYDDSLEGEEVENETFETKEKSGDKGHKSNDPDENHHKTVVTNVIGNRGIPLVLPKNNDDHPATEDVETEAPGMRVLGNSVYDYENSAEEFIKSGEEAYEKIVPELSSKDIESVENDNKENPDENKESRAATIDSEESLGPLGKNNGISPNIHTKMFCFYRVY